ncbi:MAG: membrane protein insertion efficiency factor YidD [Chlamydiota bacterium]
MKKALVNWPKSIGILPRLCYATVFSLFCFSLPLSALPYEEPWGKDAELACQETKKTVPEIPPTPLIQAADWIIQFHQKHLSPTTCKRSHFRPTSSHYAQRAIKRYGFWKGFLMSCDRLLRENDEKWVYKIIHHPEGVFKYDPAYKNKCVQLIDEQDPYIYRHSDE